MVALGSYCAPSRPDSRVDGARLRSSKALHPCDLNARIIANENRRYRAAARLVDALELRNEQ